LSEKNCAQAKIHLDRARNLTPERK